MDWKDGRRSSNVEDRRGKGGGKKAIGGGIGIGAILMALFAIFVQKQDPSAVISQTLSGAGGSGYEEGYEPTPEEQVWADMSAVVLADTEDVWNQLFPALAQSMLGKKYARPRTPKYIEPKMIWFSGSTTTACGHGDAAMGPFYCPGDDNVYIDLGFFREMEVKLNAPGDFAQAYVLAHEVGHHVQNLLGLSAFVQQYHPTRGGDKIEYNRLSVRLELLADYYAGVCLHHKRERIEDGDIEEAITAAHAIGDDTLQKNARGYAVPDSFNHGTSEQRKKWFALGLRYGDPTKHNTFEVAYEDL